MLLSLIKLITGNINFRLKLHVSKSRSFGCLQLNVVSLLIGRFGNILKINVDLQLIHTKFRLKASLVAQW